MAGCDIGDAHSDRPLLRGGRDLIDGHHLAGKGARGLAGSRGDQGSGQALVTTRV